MVRLLTVVILGAALSFPITVHAQGSGTRRSYGSGDRSSSRSSSRSSTSSRPTQSSSRSTSTRSSSVRASGGGGSGGGGLSGPIHIVKQEPYELGEQIFEQSASLERNAEAGSGEQALRLKELQEALPDYAKKKADLPALAGRLSRKQMASLEYFLEYRYGVEPTE